MEFISFTTIFPEISTFQSTPDSEILNSFGFLKKGRIFGILFEC